MRNWIKKKLGIARLEQENAILMAEVQSLRNFVTLKVAELKEHK